MIFRLFAGGGGRSWSALFVISTLGREEGTAVESWSSLSDSTEGGSLRSEEGGEAMMNATRWRVLLEVRFDLKRMYSVPRLRDEKL